VAAQTNFPRRLCCLFCYRGDRASSSFRANCRESLFHTRTIAETFQLINHVRGVHERCLYAELSNNRQKRARNITRRSVHEDFIAICTRHEFA